jgi:hypothetical protein
VVWELPPLETATSKHQNRNRYSTFLCSGEARGKAAADGPFDQEDLTGCMSYYAFIQLLWRPRPLLPPKAVRPQSSPSTPVRTQTLATNTTSISRLPSVLFGLFASGALAHSLQWGYLEMRRDSIAWTGGGHRPPMFSHCCPGRFRQASQACPLGLNLTCGKPQQRQAALSHRGRRTRYPTRGVGRCREGTSDPCWP